MLRALLLCAVVLSIPSARAVAQEGNGAPGAGTPPVAAVPEAYAEVPDDFTTALQGSAGGLTATSVAQSAVRTAPSVEHARAVLRGAQAGATRALGAFFPRIDTYFRYSRLSEVAPIRFSQPLSMAQIDAANTAIGAVTDPAARGLFQQNLDGQIAAGNFVFQPVLNQWALHAGLQWGVTDLFLTVLPAYQASNQLAHSGEYQLEAQRQTVAVQARESFYNYARARATMIVAALAVQQAEAHQADVRAAVEAGVAAPVEGMRIDAQLAAAHVQHARARGGLAAAEVALRTLLHRGPREPLTIGEDLTATPDPLRGDAEVLLTRALERRAEVRALQHVVAARDSFVGVRTGQLAPRLALVADADYANPNSRVFPATATWNGTWDVGAAVTWSPNDLFNATQDLDAANADAAAARADLASLEDGVRIEVTTAYENYQASLEALESARVGIAAAEEAYRVRRERYRAGASTTTELIDAGADLISARLNFVNAAIDLHIIDARLRRASGEDVSGAPAR